MPIHAGFFIKSKYFEARRVAKTKRRTSKSKRALELAQWRQDSMVNVANLNKATSTQNDLVAPM